ncbi:MAG: PAS domain-containing protein [Methanoregula sp.]|jgi:PAS domain S-box-containing protein
MNNTGEKTQYPPPLTQPVKTPEKTDRKQPSMTGVLDISGDHLFDAVFHAIQTGIFILDYQTHTIVDINPLALKILGYKKEEVVGKVCHEFICPSKVGSCPITDLHKTIDNSEKEVIHATGKRIPVLKTQVTVKIKDRDYIIESFTDFSDHMKAENQKVVLIGVLTDAMSRICRPLELTRMNLQIVADQIKTGEFDPEEIRMELQIQANNIDQMIKNLEELNASALKEQPEIPPEFREFLLRK